MRILGNGEVCLNMKATTSWMLASNAAEYHLKRSKFSEKSWTSCWCNYAVESTAGMSPTM